MADKKLSAKQHQEEINKSRRRWMTMFKVAAGAGVLLIAGAFWPDSDRDDPESSRGTGDEKSQ